MEDNIPLKYMLEEAFIFEVYFVWLLMKVSVAFLYLCCSRYTHQGKSNCVSPLQIIYSLNHQWHLENRQVSPDVDRTHTSCRVSSFCSFTLLNRWMLDNFQSGTYLTTCPSFSCPLRGAAFSLGGPHIFLIHALGPPNWRLRKHAVHTGIWLTGASE